MAGIADGQIGSAHQPFVVGIRGGGPDQAAGERWIGSPTTFPGSDGGPAACSPWSTIRTLNSLAVP